MSDIEPTCFWHDQPDCPICAAADGSVGTTEGSE